MKKRIILVHIPTDEWRIQTMFKSVETAQQTISKQLTRLTNEINHDLKWMTGKAKMEALEEHERRIKYWSELEVKELIIKDIK